jgi:hypothetical protein
MVNMFNMFESNVGNMVRGALCAAAMLVACGKVYGMMSEDETRINPETSAMPEPRSAKPPAYGSDWYERGLWGSGTLEDDGYLALQKDYPHEKKNFESTKVALENMLSDIKFGTFKNPGMQLVLDYMHWWYYVDPEQVYKAKRTHIDPITGYWHLDVYEFQIQDLAAQILDELQQTGGTAYATLHWCDRK